MYVALRFGKVVGRFLGSRDPLKTKQIAVERFGAGVTVKPASLVAA